MIKPPFKWAGGKTRLLPEIHKRLPSSFSFYRYVEPFFGGGALFFDRLPARAVLSDENEALIETYLAIRDDVDGVLEALLKLTGSTYYELRNLYNTTNDKRTQADHAAMFMYLTKTCFNGIYRVNSQGKFNAPKGSYSSPSFDVENLRAVSSALKKAEIRCQSFAALLEYAKPGDFIYFDPPYAPISETSKFTSYTKGGFSKQDQEHLAEVVKTLSRRGCKCLLSNSDVPYLHELYKDFEIERVLCMRAIASNSSRRGYVHEILVRNYLTEE